MLIAKGEGGRGPKARWTPDKVETLARLYPIATREGLMNALSGLTWGQIRSAAYRYNIVKLKLWTTTEDARLREVYPSMPWKDMLKEFPGRTVMAIYHRAKVIGLHRRPQSARRLPPLIRSLVERRKALGWSQDFLARRIGIDHSLVSRWECGKAKPVFPYLMWWVEALDARLVLKVKESVNVDVCGRAEERGAAGKVCSERAAGGKPNGVRTAPQSVGGDAFSSCGP